MKTNPATLKAVRKKLTTFKAPLVLIIFSFFLNNLLIATANGATRIPAYHSNREIRPADTATVPSIVYSGPQIYTVGAAIPPLIPSAKGVAAPGYSGSPVKAAGVNYPYSVALDSGGNLYVVDGISNFVTEIPKGGGPVIKIGQGLLKPMGVAVDGSGNIYVADTEASAIIEILAGGNTELFIGSGFFTPTGVAVDAAGDIYVADTGHNQVKMVPRDGGDPVTLGWGFNHPTGVAVDTRGNVYVTDFGNNAVKKMPAGGGTPKIIATGFNHPQGLTVDVAGNVFVADYSNNLVKEIPAAGGSPVVIGSGFSDPAGVAVDGFGRLFVADYLNSAIKIVRPVGGFFVNQALPPGLNFDFTTGVITGTPTAVTFTSDYIITAYNQNGNGKAQLGITVKAVLPGNISYVSPQTFYVNKPVAVYPGGAGWSAPGYNAVAVGIANGFSQPVGVATDPAGNIYVADRGKNAVYKIPKGNGAPVAIGSGFLLPGGIAVDAAGNVYVADEGHKQVKKIPAGGGATGVIGSGFGNPQGLAVDAGGNVFVADAGNSVIVKIPAGGGAPVTLGSGFLSPFGVAVDGHGNVYVADKGNNAVKEIPVDSSAVMTLGSGFSGPKGVWADAMGNVYVADAGHSAIKEIPAGGGSIVTIGNAVARPGALTVNGAGIVFVTDETGGVVESVTPVGGYYIDKVLPEGLVFGPYEGTIGGTPLKISPATNYVVTYYSPYFSGSASATLNIKVTSGNVYLYAIKMSSGTLSPAFAYNVDNYTDSVTSAQSSIMVKPIPSDSLATITVNGSPVSAKMSSPPIPLNAGLNNITIKVTAQDGTTTGTYTVAVIRGAGPLNTPEADASFNQDSKAPVGDGDIVIVHPGVTPNGDGKNDFLAIDGLLAYPDNKLTIMNRNGAVIFEAKGYGNASKVFDGHSSKTGQMQLPGTYFYSLEYTANGIARHKTGFLVLKY